MPYKDVQLAIKEFNCNNKNVNNHAKISEATNKVGEILHEVKIGEKIEDVKHCLAHLRHIVKILDWFHIRQAYDKAISSVPKYQVQLNSSKHKVW
jgi:hypothetical protein